MSTGRLLPQTGIAFACVLMTACVARDVRDDVQGDVPDYVLQHSLSSLTSEQSFTWDGPRGKYIVIRPLGTFRSGDFYCRDYQIEREGASGRPIRRTACRFDQRWTDVDPTNLDV